MTEHLGGQEKGGSPDILDFGTHGAVYGRFLLASLPGADTANIIDPYKTVEFNALTVDALKDRNYNPVAENFSLAERKEDWKGVEYSQAYSQWRTQFTDFMTRITDPNRMLALKTIVPNKESRDFTASDADTLFNKFCKGGSDINNFITRVTTNLDRNGKIDPKELTELLPHLKWIASGLFGKNTASQVVTRLIELESELHNDPQAVLEKLNLNKERVNTPQPQEKDILGALYQILPPQQKTEPVIDADISGPAASAIPKQGEEDELLSPPVGEIPPEPPPPSVPTTAEKPIEDINLKQLDAELNRILGKVCSEGRSEFLYEKIKRQNELVAEMSRGLSEEEKEKLFDTKEKRHRIYLIAAKEIFDKKDWSKPPATPPVPPPTFVSKAFVPLAGAEPAPPPTAEKSG